MYSEIIQLLQRSLACSLVYTLPPESRHEVALKDKTDNQKFPVTAEVPGRWLRLTIKTNHGAKDYIELMDFRGYGTQLTKTPFPDASGTYETNFSDFHLKQQGTSVTGCYKELFGLWWNEGDNGLGGFWNGTRKSASVGT